MTETTDSGRRDLPPPTGAPVGETGPGAGGPSKPFWADWGLPFDNPREAAEWWFGPLLDVRTWVALGYLLAGAILASIWFAAVVVMLAVSLPLIIVLIGIPLTVLSFSAIAAFAGVERQRAAWVGDPIPPRPFAPRADSWWSRLITRLTDPTRWRQVAFFLASVVVLPALFAFGALPLSIMVQAATSFDTPTPFGGFVNVGSLLLVLLMAGLVGRAAIFFAGIAHAYVEWFLGPDRTAELEARVDTLSEQRAEILEAVSAERRRIERNLHDGVQQQLVAIGIDIGRAQARIGDDPEGARLLLDEARDKVRGSVGELRMIGRGLHPAVLDDRGLDAALSSIVASSPIPIDVNVDVDDRIPIDVAETAYYVANEAVANLLKHASARVASIHVVEVRTPRPAIALSVHDDGRGGASMSASGSGLVGMAARVRGVDGVFSVDSPPGGPTLVKAVIPLPGGDADG